MARFNQVVAKVKINGRNRYVHVYERKDGSFMSNLVTRVHRGTHVPAYMRNNGD